MTPAVALLRAALLIVACCCLADCGPHILGDEGEWLGEKIGDAATTLRRSPEPELVLVYQPESGVNQRYSIGIGKSLWCPEPPCYENHGSLTVLVERGRHGSTTYHTRFVAVPRFLEIQKDGQTTQIVLRKTREGIALIDLR